VIPSDQAYGADGAGDLIAPFTPLVFEVELRGATS
jgi:peptidylprolyl isomerase/FKBP-type peptidyl-prolyl cis-trans isomerase FklB